MQTRLSWTFATSSAGLTLNDRQPDLTIWLELGWTVEQHCHNVKINIATKCQEKKNRIISPRPMDNSGADLALSCQVKCFRWKSQKQYSTTHNNTDTIKTQWLCYSLSLLHNINMIISAVGAVQTTDWPRELGSHLISDLLKNRLWFGEAVAEDFGKVIPESLTVWQAVCGEGKWLLSGWNICCLAAHETIINKELTNMEGATILLIRITTDVDHSCKSNGIS